MPANLLVFIVILLVVRYLFVLALHILFAMCDLKLSYRTSFFLHFPVHLATLFYLHFVCLCTSMCLILAKL